MIVTIGGIAIDLDNLDARFIVKHNFTEKELDMVAVGFDRTKHPFIQPLGQIYEMKYMSYEARITEINTEREQYVQRGLINTVEGIGVFTHLSVELAEMDKQIQPYLNSARMASKSIELYEMFTRLRRHCTALCKVIKIDIETASQNIRSNKNTSAYVSVVKIPDLPSFEVWFTEHGCKYILNHGDYYIAIAQTGWSKKDTTFHFAVATADNPLNIYSSPIFDKVIRVDNNHDDDWYKEELEQWYESTVDQFNKFWVDYIERTYLNERSTNNAGDKNT